MSDFHFPVLANCAPVKYPLGRTITFNTHVTRFLDDSEQRFQRRRRLDFFAIRLVGLDAADLDRLYGFWEDVRGPLASWDITVDGILYKNCNFLNDDFAYEEPEDSPERYSVSLSAKQTIPHFAIPAGAPGDFPVVLDGEARSLSGPIRRFQRGYRTTASMRTAMIDHPISGLRYAYPLRNSPIETPSHAALYVWDCPFRLEPAAALAIENHFMRARGRWKRFGFTDPRGNRHADCRYANDTLELTYAGPADTEVRVAIEQFRHVDVGDDIAGGVGMTQALGELAQWPFENVIVSNGCLEVAMRWPANQVFDSQLCLEVILHA